MALQDNQGIQAFVLVEAEDGLDAVDIILDKYGDALSAILYMEECKEFNRYAQ